MCVCVYIYTYMCLCVCLVNQSCSTLCDPMDCCLQVSSVSGILQARILEWVVIKKKVNCEQAHLVCAPEWNFTEAMLILQIKLMGRKGLQELLKATEIVCILKSRDISWLTNVHISKLWFFQ